MAPRVHVPVEQRREQLTEAAMQVMRRDGAWALTTRAVAKQAGVPLGAVHYAFASKSDLIASVFAADVESAARTAQSAVEAGGSAEDIVTRALRTWMTHVQSDPLIEAVLQELTLMGVRDAELEAPGRTGVVDYRNGVVAFFDQVAEQCDREWAISTTVLAEIVFSHFVGLAQNWLITRDDELLDDCVEEIIDYVCGRLR